MNATQTILDTMESQIAVYLDHFAAAVKRFAAAADAEGRAHWGAIMVDEARQLDGAYAMANLAMRAGGAEPTEADERFPAYDWAERLDIKIR